MRRSKKLNESKSASILHLRSQTLAKDLRGSKSATMLNRGPGRKHRTGSQTAVAPPSLLMARRGTKTEERPPSFWNVAPDLMMSDLEFDLRQKQSFDFEAKRRRQAAEGPTRAQKNRSMLQRRASILGYNELNRTLRFPSKHRDQMETDTESESDDDRPHLHRGSVDSHHPSTAAESTAATLRSARLSVAGDEQAALFPNGLRRGDYVGKQAKPRYFDVYRRILRKGKTVPLHLPLDDVVRDTLAAAPSRDVSDDDGELLVDDDDVTEAPGAVVTGKADAEIFEAWDSPRHVFARCCAELAPLGCLPEPLFIRSGAEGDAEKIDLSHRALGDGLACAFAKIIPNIPRLITLNMRDNRMTDVGIAAVLHAVCTHNGGGCPRLTNLNLSQNDIDLEAVESIAEFVSFSGCALKKLTLETADLDDTECGVLMKAMTVNTHLTEMSVRGNILGGYGEKLLRPVVIEAGDAAKAPPLAEKAPWNASTKPGGLLEKSPSRRSSFSSSAGPRWHYAGGVAVAVMLVENGAGEA